MKVHFRFATIAVLLAGVVFAAHAETPKAGEKISLKLKLTKGDKKSFVATENMTNQLSAGGQNVDITTKMTTNTEMEVKDVAADGIATVDVIHKRVQVTASGPLEMKYDSDDPATANNLLAQQVKGLAGKSVSVKFDPQAKVVADKDADEAKISAKLKDSIDQLLSVLPSEPVAVGDSWEHDLDLKSEPTMPMKISGKYTLKDVRDGVAYVKYDAKITSTADIKGTIEGDAEIDQKTGLTTKFVGKMKAEGKQGGANFKLDAEMSVKAE